MLQAACKCASVEVCRSYQIKAKMAAGVPVFERWKRVSTTIVSKFRTGGELAGPARLVPLPKSSDMMLLVAW